MTTQPHIIRFLQRPDAKETWHYERPPILLVELLCLLAGIWAAPTREARWLLAITAPLSLWGTELGRRARSGAARKTELAESMGIPTVKLRCERDIEQAAKNQQLVTATAPVVALACTVASAGGAGLTKAALVGFVVSVVRWAMVELYGAWRRWYRWHVPITVAVKASPAKLAAVASDVIIEGIASNASMAEVGAELEKRLSVQHFEHKPTTQLAETSPYQSADLAKMAEQILRDKDGAA